MTKAKKILALLSAGKSIKEVAKATKSKPAYVYYVRWTDAQKKAKRPKLKTQQAPVQAEPVNKPDLVNNPPHYTDGGVDTLTYIEAKDLNYRLGNVIKYVSRAGKKSDSDPVQDLEKAAWYLKREIETRKGA